MPTAAPWQPVPGGVALMVRLTPRGGRDAIEGVAQAANGRSVLNARVRAAPTEGKANDALVRMLARAVGVPARDVFLAGGATGRIKRLVISGYGPTITAALEKIVERV